MANERSGQVSLVIAGRRYTGHYVLEGDELRVSNEIGTLVKRYQGNSLSQAAEQLLARLVREELKNA
jgi:hypothetical protein